MTQPRKSLISLSDTPYYHCVSRCVRRAYLCGADGQSGRDYSHRKQWVKDRLALLSHAFAIDICAYAVMSNHYHLVLCVDCARADSWSDLEVIDRWQRIFKVPDLIRRLVHGEQLDVAEREAVAASVGQWRARLASISWYMRCLNEPIARQANAEDGCTGHFWESRFKCQALLDTVALATAMAYVDLNPIRAGMATDLITSSDTSVQQRLSGLSGLTSARIAIPLKAFNEADLVQDDRGLPFVLHDYLSLVDWTGRIVREGKGAVIAATTPGILDLLAINTAEWIPTVTALQARFELVVGAPWRLRRAASDHGRCFYRGYGSAKRLYRAHSSG